MPFAKSCSVAKTSDLDGLAAGLMPGAIHLSMSTISTAAALDWRASMRVTDKATSQRRCSAIRMPPRRASCSSSPPALRPMSSAAGRSSTVSGNETFVVGTDPEHANLIKLLGNMMTATALEMLGEVVAVIRKRGLDPRPFVDIMTSTMFGGRVHKIYGDKIASGALRARIRLPLVLKDVRLALAEAENAGAPMPSVSVVRDRLITGIARGYGDLDWTALGLIAAEEAGLHGPLPPAVNAGSTSGWTAPWPSPD